MPDDFDPPHERNFVEQNLGTLQNGSYPMTGFVSAIPDSVSLDPQTRKLVMSHFGAEQVPITHFLADNFCICDRWFCSLPAGTQPNRLMFMSGFSLIDYNQTPLHNQELVYDWLTQHNVSWRVYHQGLPFFAMMPKWVRLVLFDSQFRNFADFEGDVINTPPDDMPQVIFVEPTYGDAPHVGHSSDDHAPSGVADGQEFLMQVYSAVTASPSFWRSSVLIVNYDEGGGFFDHVSPPLVKTEPPQPGLYKPFDSLGVRVPAYVVSPFVERGSVSHTILDHTSVLKLLGEKFDRDGSYSPLVDTRPVGSVSDILRDVQPTIDPPAAPSVHEYLDSRPSASSTVVTRPRLTTPLQHAFANCTKEMGKCGAGPDHDRFGALLEDA